MAVLAMCAAYRIRQLRRLCRARTPQCIQRERQQVILSAQPAALNQQRQRLHRTAVAAGNCFGKHLTGLAR